MKRLRRFALLIPVPLWIYIIARYSDSVDAMAMGHSLDRVLVLLDELHVTLLHIDV